MPRFIISDPDTSGGWSHIWKVETDAGDLIDVERTCRFVLDTDQERLVHVDIDVDGTMVLATRDEVEDLLDSLVIANPDVFDDPESCGLEVSNRLPAWCTPL